MSLATPDTTCHMSISLDGFVAGPDQSREYPLGKGGRELHLWHLGDERANEADETAAGWLMRPRGAYVMGRNMFGPVRGEWEEDWRGWGGGGGGRAGGGGPGPAVPRTSVRADPSRARADRDGGRDDLPLRHRRLRRRLRTGTRDGRRRRRGHRRRRLHRSAGARRRDRRRAHPRHRPGPARLRRADLRRRRTFSVGTHRGAALAAGHAHPLPPGKLKPGSDTSTRHPS